VRLAAALLALVLAPAAARTADLPPDRSLVEAYDRLHAAALDGPAHAGRDVELHGRPSDGRPSWSLLRAEARRLWLELHPALAEAHEAAQGPRAPDWWLASSRRVALCESGGRPDAVSAGGDYRGKWQFDLSTWAGVGGTGDPAAAPEAEQDGRAYLLWQRRGWQPWPVCGALA
jgi:hypothetical protein